MRSKYLAGLLVLPLLAVVGVDVEIAVQDARR